MVIDRDALIAENPALADAAELRECLWVNPGRRRWAEVSDHLPVSAADVRDAEVRLSRLAPLVARVFPETAAQRGIIESETRAIPAMAAAIGPVAGSLLIKLDSHLPVAGSVKARGGIYEVLKHAEGLALEAGLLTPRTNPAVLAEPRARAFFGEHVIQVGSTGNLGLSIGISSAALGFRAIVHMSADAKQWKKDLLRSHGVEVVEYAGDYGKAVEQGRAASALDPTSHFVDDENSLDLFLGYAVAARRLAPQLDAVGGRPSREAPLVVHLPCGVGGAPGGIAFGLKTVFGDAVRPWFVEPTHAPCMLVGMASGLHHRVSVADLGIDGVTEADGLAVGRASGLVGRIMEPVLEGIITVDDARLLPWLRQLDETEGIQIEPSAAAAFAGPTRLAETGLDQRYQPTAQLAWATGGALVPDEIMAGYLGR